MQHFRLYLPILIILLFACNQPDSDKKQAPAAPSLPVQVEITDLHYWMERGTFFVTGICNSRSDQWQKVWLRMEPLDKTGKPLQIGNLSGMEFPVFSAAIPPRGRSSFFQGWMLKDFSGRPDSCRVTGARAEAREAGPILLVEDLSTVRMQSPGNDGTPGAERGVQISGVLSNPLTINSEHPQLELLLYGTDNVLWLSTVLDPEDPALKNTLTMEGSGPLPAGGKRRFGTQVTYGNLPQELNNRKISRVEILAFENR